MVEENVVYGKLIEGLQKIVLNNRNKFSGLPPFSKYPVDILSIRQSYILNFKHFNSQEKNDLYQLFNCFDQYVNDLAKKEWHL